MEKVLTNIFFFITLLLVLVGLFYYTAKTKEAFFDTNASEIPIGVITILGGRNTDGNGYNVYINNKNSVPNKCVFNNKNYADYYPDLYAAFGDDNTKLVQHYINNGIYEGRTPCGYENTNCKWSPNDYINFYKFQGTDAAIWPLDHYQQNGIYEGRTPCPYATPENISKLDCRKYKNEPCPNDWTQISGTLYSISLAPNRDLFGTDVQGNIYYKAQNTTDFKQVSGNLKMLDTDGSFVCGVDSNNDIYCAANNDAINGQWTKIGSNAKWITVSSGKAYIVNTDNSISFTTDMSNLNNIAWQQVPISYKRFHKLALDGNTLVGIDDNNQLFFADENVFTTKPNFMKMFVKSDMTNFVNISLHENSVLVTDYNGQLWYGSNYKGTTWNQIKTNVDFVFMAVHVNQAAYDLKFTYQNNGTVTCATYCGGTGGKPWNNELPEEWNGATAVGSSGGIPNIYTTFNNPDGQEYCVCKKSGWGWAQ